MFRCLCASSARVAPLPEAAAPSTSASSTASSILPSSSPPLLQKWIIDEFGERIQCDANVSLQRAFDDASRAAAADIEISSQWRTVLHNAAQFRAEHSDAYVSLCLRGVPPSMRADVWMHITGAAAMMRQHASAADALSYASLCVRAASNPSPSLRQIAVDVPRTHGAHAFFGDATPASARPALLRVLHCVALAEPEIGYMQGMNMIVALFLVVCGDEERAFWLMRVFLRSYGMLEYYRDGLARLRASMEDFERLLLAHLPLLGAHMHAEGVLPHCYCTPWFITCFAYNCQLSSAARVFDVFFLLRPGDAFIHRFGLAYLQSRERQLGSAQFSELVVETKEMQFDDVDVSAPRGDAHGCGCVRGSGGDDDELDPLFDVLLAAHRLDLDALAVRAQVCIRHMPFPDVPSPLPQLPLPPEAIVIVGADEQRPHTPPPASSRPGSARSVRVVHARPSSASIRLRAVTVETPQ